MSASSEPILETVVDYVLSKNSFSENAFMAARLSLFDAIGCLMAAHKTYETQRYLGPLFSDNHGTTRVLGTNYKLDPGSATFQNGLLLRWLDFNDTFLAYEWAHPSDNLAVLLSLGDYLCQKNEPVQMGTLLELLIKAYEVQGIFSLNNSFNAVGLDHVLLVKVTSAAIATALLGGKKDQLFSAISHAFSDLGPLRTYRHEPNVTARKSWAAGDMSARGLLFALLAIKGEPPVPSPISAPKWGLNALFFKEKPLNLSRSLGSFVIENILYKTNSPTEYHAQTALEAAVQLYPIVKGRLDEIETIFVETHEAAMRIIVKEGILRNPQDRDHCMQYVIAIGLLFGNLTSDHYEIETAKNPIIDKLRSKMRVQENLEFSKGYLDPEKRSCASSIQIQFKDGSKSEKVVKEYPLGHPKRRKEAHPLLLKKFEENCKGVGIGPNISDALALYRDAARLDRMTVSDFISYFIPENRF